MRNYVNTRHTLNALLERCTFLSKHQGLALVVLALLILSAGVSPSQAQSAGTGSYTVLSVKPDEVIVKIQPKYSVQTVTDSSGRAFTEMTIPDGFLTDSAGAPEVMRIGLSFLAPSRRPATVEIVSQSLEVLPGIDLAPIPSYTNRNGTLIERYTIRNDRYYTPSSEDLFRITPVSVFRTAFKERVIVSPIEYDAQSRSVTRVKSLTLRIRFADASKAMSSSSNQSGITISSEEAEFFRTLFLNGSITNFYATASAGWTYALKSQNKNSINSMSVLSASGDGEWLEITTNSEGIYHISAEDLANNGITGPIDPTDIELFGIGGAMLNENPTDSSGEWLECPIEVHANGQNFSDLYFYASGASVWKYQGSLGGTDGLFHDLNPYTSTGHFLLKVGGNLISQALRIPTQPDSLLRQPVPTALVLTATCHESDHILEQGAGGADNVGREMLDQGLTQGIPVQVSLDAPGFVSDSTVVRVAYDAKIDTSDTGSIAVQINNNPIGNIPSRIGDNPDRNWDHPLVIDPSITAPFNLTISFSSSSVSALAWLDFVELVYRRSTDVGSQSIPFMLMDNGGAFQYQFTSATGGEIWDITNALAPHIVASANGSNIPVALQGQRNAMRKFFAFSAQSVLSPTITAIAVPSLRSTVCQTGATEIIIAPQAFLSEANELAQLRQQGGQATEAMSASVVTLESIYQEFGYGNSDIVAVRDFMSYLFHHAATRPLYLTLLGGGHCDYQNRQTAAPEQVPPYETVWYEDDPSDFRATIGLEPNPDDGFFVHLSDTEYSQDYDLAVGRVSARDEADAAAYVSKVQHYEHASDTGIWRSIGTFLADDRYDPDYYPNQDPLQHMADTQGEIGHLQDRVIVNKIYEESYPTTYSADGQRLKPGVNAAIIDALNSGTVLFSFIGHGNPTVWTHESVLYVPSSINQLTNFDRLAYLTTATCNFSLFDDFTVFSGGELFLMKPDGGAIGLLGTCRSVTDHEPLVQSFYQTLFQAADGHGTSTVGQALLAGKSNGSSNYPFFYLLGDPAQRLLLPKLYVSFDSVNAAPLSSAPLQMSALSKVRISGSIRDDSTMGSPTESGFNGTVTVTLYDTPSQVFASFVSPVITINDSWLTDGPILYRGTASVTNGQFSLSFIVPRDVKLDSGAAQFSGYAYSGSDGRTALGDNESIHLVSADSDQAYVGDTTGPSLSVWLGSRAFRSGDEVSMNSTIIVDVKDILGLNTSTASIGHSFIGWVDDAEDSAVDLTRTYISAVNDFTSGTSEQPISLPAGHHTLHVRAFDTYDNAAFASVDFIAMNESPYQVYDVAVFPDPMQDHTTFSFVQPGQSGSLVNVTLSIYTADGGLIRTLTTSSSESAIEIPWDGRDANGTSVANGAYFFVANVQDIGDGTSAIATGKCIVAR